MGRENTVIFGSQGRASTPEPRPGPRTRTLVQERSVNERARVQPHPVARMSPASVSPQPRARYQSDPGPTSAPAPVSNRVESQWFAPTNPRLAPVGHEIFEERRGWQPPPPSRGLAFAGISALLVAVAAAGTVFFFGPDRDRSPSTPVSTTTITNADVPTTPTPEPETTPAPLAAPTTMQTVTPNDLPSAPPVVDAVKEPGVRPAKIAAGSANTTTVRAQRSVTSGKPVTSAAKKSDGALPDLDRAASAAGMTPQQDDPFATPGTETPPATSATTASAPPATPSGSADDTTSGSTEPSTPPTSAPAPSEVMPDLQIKR